MPVQHHDDACPPQPTDATAAEIDYRLKQQAHIVGPVLNAITEVKTRIGKTPGKTARD